MTRTLFGLLIFLPLSASAQRVTITPTAGFYAPQTEQGTWVTPLCGFSGCFGTEYGQVDVTYGSAFGVTLGLGWDRRHTIEASVITASAERRTSRELVSDYNEGFTEVVSQSVRNTFLTLQYRRAWSLSRRTDFAIGIGTALTKLDGSAYEDLRKQTYFGPMGSLSLSTAVGRTRVGFSIADAMYSIQYTQPPDGSHPLDGTQTSYMQHDLLLTVGLQLGGRK